MRRDASERLDLVHDTNSTTALLPFHVPSTTRRHSTPSLSTTTQQLFHTLSVCIPVEHIVSDSPSTEMRFPRARHRCGCDSLAPDTSTSRTLVHSPCQISRPDVGSPTTSQWLGLHVCAPPCHPSCWSRRHLHRASPTQWCFSLAVSSHRLHIDSTSLLSRTGSPISSCCSAEDTYGGAIGKA